MTGTALDVDALIPPVDANPPSDLDTANTYWERLESMRLRVPGNALVTDGLDVFPGTADAEMWLVRGDSEIAQRTGYAQRVFRDAHPLDDLPGLVDNGNGYRILVGALGLKSLANDNTLLLPPSPDVRAHHERARRGAELLVQQVPPRDRGDAVARERHRPGAERAADRRQQADRVLRRRLQRREPLRLSRRPERRLRLRRQPGCPASARRSTTCRQATRSIRSGSGLIAQQIVGDLHAPDILLVQEAEDQDICTVVRRVTRLRHRRQRGRKAGHAAGAGAAHQGPERRGVRRGLRPGRRRRPRHRRGADVPDGPGRAAAADAAIRSSARTPRSAKRRRATPTTRRSRTRSR